VYNVKDELFLAIADIAMGLRDEMAKTGKPMLPEEIAAVMMCFSLQQSAFWLEKTLDKTAEERLDQAALLLQYYELLMGQ
jgi:hypothetical protein